MGWKLASPHSYSNLIHVLSADTLSGGCEFEASRNIINKEQPYPNTKVCPRTILQRALIQNSERIAILGYQLSTINAFG
jgi:hypothetical protein